MSDLERVALRVRHEAALAVLRAPEPPAGWRLLLEVVAPSEAFREESERRALELLETRAAAA
jgi:hypothetical protein